ncbi:C1q-related factor-like [Cottoperca gobio]|uniref:C1q-related factor-like n=1 Tax=Cottoperca gobio TaxID=56716 RepID=A0A6J2PET5_COTGO|nr:C1q-related factor-like [Cottoperca gobio]
MKQIAVLILAFSCAVCEEPTNENVDKVRQCSGSTSCCDIYSLTSISQNLGAVGEKVANMAEKITLLEAKLQNTEKEVLELRSLTGGNIKQMISLDVMMCYNSSLYKILLLVCLWSFDAGTHQVAFSATLRDSGNGDIGPFTTNTPLKYKRIFANTGNSYNAATGIFTATVKGTYFFRFSMFNNLSPTPNSVVSLMKNGERLTSVWDTAGADSHDMGSNAVVIALEVGDNVYVDLQANRVVFDDSMNYNTFSSFLLFTV